MVPPAGPDTSWSVTDEKSLVTMFPWLSSTATSGCGLHGRISRAARRRLQPQELARRPGAIWRCGAAGSLMTVVAVTGWPPLDAVGVMVSVYCSGAPAMQFDEPVWKLDPFHQPTGDGDLVGSSEPRESRRIGIGANEWVGVHRVVRVVGCICYFLLDVRDGRVAAVRVDASSDAQLRCTDDNVIEVAKALRRAKPAIPRTTEPRALPPGCRPVPRSPAARSGDGCGATSRRIA